MSDLIRQKLKYASIYLYLSEDDILEESLNDYLQKKHIDLLVKKAIEASNERDSRVKRDQSK